MRLDAWIEHCANAMSEAGLAFGHGTENASDEAAWLVCASMGIEPGGEIANLEVGAEQANRIRELLARRIKSRKPLAYLLGEAWFCGMKFEVTDRVLVPRSPIGELIMAGFEPWLKPEKIRRVLDLCTGSGALAIATARYLPGARITASDISMEALKVAGRNACLHQVEDRIEFIHSDLFDEIPGRRFDLIISNPPYVAPEVFRDLPSEYHAEPELALVSGGAGIEIPMRILAAAADFLAPDGVLICEVGESAETLHRALPGIALTWFEFEGGGDGVFVMDREQLVSHRQQVNRYMENLDNVV